MRRIVCTTGTSIAGEILKSGGTPTAEGIRRSLKKLEGECSGSESEFLRRACAESNSLRALEVSGRDRVHFLHTDTELGLLCAAEVGELVACRFRTGVSLHRIPGLQVSDAAEFRRNGIDRLFRKLRELSEDGGEGPGAGVVLNVTGGFKSVVPYLTVYGMLRRLPVYYIFENSESIIKLQPVPINYDYERIGQARAAVLRLMEEGVMKREDFFSLVPGIDHSEREYFESLVEEHGGLVAPSAFAGLFFEASQREACEVLLSPSARKSLERSSGDTERHYLFILNRLSDPLWRRAKIHSFRGTDLEVYKPGNMSERAAAKVRGRRVYVCELLQHDEYVRELSGRNFAGYPPAGFLPWHPASGGDDIPRSEEEYLERESGRRRAAEEENARLSGEVLRLREEVRRLSSPR